VKRLRRINNKMETLLGGENARIDALYFRRASRGRAGLITSQAPFRITLFDGRSFYRRHPDTTLSVAITGSTLRLNSAKS
jgi:hypothetical protein